MINKTLSDKPKMGILQNLIEDIRKNYQLYIILLPSLAYFIIFHYWPMYGVQIAFRNFIPARGIWGSEWYGLYHLQRFFNSYSSKIVIGNTIKLSLFSLIAGFPFPIILALMLNELRSKKFMKTLQLISYLPHFISTVALTSMIMIMFTTRGVYNVIRAYFGAEAINLLTDANKFVWLYVISGIWQGAGWGSIIYFAALSNIDVQLHEAAIMDGANKVQRIWHIDLPGIVPIIVIQLILSCGGIMSVSWEKVFLLQNPLNLSTSEVISTYVYKMGLLNMDYSYSSAIGLFNSVINLIMLVAVNTIARRISEYSLW